MHFLFSLLSLASLGLNLLPAQSAAVPAAGLISRSDNNVNHENLVVRSAHDYHIDDDEEIAKRFISRSAHDYGIDDDEEIAKRFIPRSAHDYGIDDDEEITK